MEKVETIFTIGDQRSGIIETTNFRHVSNIFCLNVDFYVSMILGMPQTYSNYQMIYNYNITVCKYVYMKLFYMQPYFSYPNQSIDRLPKYLVFPRLQAVYYLNHILWCINIVFGIAGNTITFVFSFIFSHERI